MTVWNCALVSGASRQDTSALAAFSFAFSHEFPNFVVHLAIAGLYFVRSPLVANFTSAFCRQAASLPAALSFANWHFCCGVPSLAAWLLALLAAGTGGLGVGVLRRTPRSAGS